MRLVFSGLEHAVSIRAGVPTVLQIENRELFSRVCQSIEYGEGRYAVEPYTIWDDEDSEVSPNGWALYIGYPLDLPWDDKALLGGASRRFEQELIADEELRGSVEKLYAMLSSRLLSAGVGLSAEYCLDLEWDAKRYLKACGFGVDRSSHSKYLESLIEFLSFFLDSGDKRVLIFVNLKSFLTKKEVQKLYEHVSFAKSRVVLLENQRDVIRYERERKYSIDLQFLENFEGLQLE